MAKTILLSSETFVKSVSNISDNVAGNYILPSLREAQEIKLKSILGARLLAKLKDLVNTGALSDSGNTDYAELVENCQYFLAYSTIALITEKVTYKIANFGVVKSQDENLSVATPAEVSHTKEYYQSKADFYAYELQGWLLDNRVKFPELNEKQCRQIHSNLYSAASCGIWLGGARGKGPYYNQPRCRRWGK
jgi:hypothetical protein